MNFSGEKHAKETEAKRTATPKPAGLAAKPASTEPPRAEQPPNQRRPVYARIPEPPVYPKPTDAKCPCAHR
jgi:hypothetical protein